MEATGASVFDHTR